MKNNIKDKVLAIVLLSALLFSSCSEVQLKETEQVSEDSSFIVGNNTRSASGSKETLTFFTRKKPDNYNSLNDTGWYKLIEKATGISISFIHPDADHERDQLYVLIASQNMPDIMRNDWVNYPGGPDKAIIDKVIIPLNDILPAYSPNYWKLLCDNSKIRQYVVSDSKQFYQYAMIRDPKTSVFWGPIIRKDWLDDLDLNVPETIDDWETMLKAFKDRKLAKSPLTYSVNYGRAANGFITGAFGIKCDYYIDDNGNIKYGYAEKGFKDFMALYRKWYKGGLIDKDIANISKELVHAKMLSGESGAMVGQATGDMSAILDKKPLGGFELTGARMPVLDKGQFPKFGHGNFGIDNEESVAISTTCKNVETAAEFLDYSYSEEGILLTYYGISDVAVSNSVKPEVSHGEEITEEQTGKNRNVNYPGFINISFEERLEQYSYAETREAVRYYVQTDNLKHMLPSITLLPSESDTIAAMKEEIQAYTDSMYLEFLFGERTLDYFDTFVEKIKQMGLKDVITAMQSALERYNKR